MNSTEQQAKNIFLAEDDAEDRMFFEDVLKEVSINTHLVMADDGVELINILDEQVPPSPDIIFLGLNMPGKNGFECLKEIRQTAQLKELPVVIFSTSGEKSYPNRIIERPGHRHKPSNQRKIPVGNSLNDERK